MSTRYNNTHNSVNSQTLKVPWIAASSRSNTTKFCHINTKIVGGYILLCMYVFIVGGDSILCILCVLSVVMGLYSSAEYC